MKKTFSVAFLALILVATSSYRTIYDWYTYTSAEGKFKVMMPAAPEEQTQKVPSAIGELTMYMAMLQAEDESADNLLYMTAYCEYPSDKVSSDMPKETLDKFFKGAAEGSAGKMNGKVLSIEESTYKNFPVRNVVASMEVQGMKFMAVQRMILVKNKFYMLQTLSTEGKEKNDNAKKFFDSFTLQD